MTDERLHLDKHFIDRRNNNNINNHSIVIMSKTTATPDVGFALDLLPDDILVLIGKTVAKLCGVHDYNAILESSERLESILADVVVVQSIIETEGDRVLDRFQESSGIDEVIILHYPENFRDLQLWQTGLETMADNKIYFDGTEPVDVGNADRVLRAIAATMDQNPSSMVILDCHCGLNDAENGLTVAYHLVQGFVNNGPEAIEWAKARVVLRRWGTTVADNALNVLDVQDEHRQQVARGKGWVEVFFRSNGKVEFPPRSVCYEMLPYPKEVLYADKHDFVALINTNPDLSAEDLEESIMKWIVKSLGRGFDAKLILESLLVEFRVTGTTALPTPHELLEQLISRREETMAPSRAVAEAANDDAYGLLIEIITKAEYKKPKTLLAKWKKAFLRNGTTAMGPWIDGLVRDLIDEGRL